MDAFYLTEEVPSTPRLQILPGVAVSFCEFFACIYLEDRMYFSVVLLRW